VLAYLRFKMWRTLRVRERRSLCRALPKNQWRCQLWGTGTRAPSTSNSFIFSSLWSKSESQLSKYCV